MKKQNALILLFILGGFAWAGAVKATPVLWAGNMHWYEVVPLSGASWDQARTQTQLKAADWDLATLTSRGEQDFIAGLLGTHVPSDFISEYRIGGYQDSTAGEPDQGWKWVTLPEAFSSFVNWMPGEPNDSGRENHLAMDNRYSNPIPWAWNDNDPFLSGYIGGYVVENQIPVPVPLAMVLFGTGPVGMGGYIRRYVNR